MRQKPIVVFRATSLPSISTVFFPALSKAAKALYAVFRNIDTKKCFLSGHDIESILNGLNLRGNHWQHLEATTATACGMQRQATANSTNASGFHASTLIRLNSSKQPQKPMWKLWEHLSKPFDHQSTTAWERSCYEFVEGLRSCLWKTTENDAHGSEIQAIAAVRHYTGDRQGLGQVLSGKEGMSQEFFWFFCWFNTFTNLWICESISFKTKLISSTSRG